MAGLYVINQATLRAHGPVPVEIQAYITQAEYSSVCSEVNRIASESMLMTCGIEIGVCCLTGCFCIFCAHPCIQEMIISSNLPPRLMSLNSSLYRGLPILSLSGHSVAFNTGLLAQNGRVAGSGAMVAPQSMQMAHVVAAPGGSAAMQPVPTQKSGAVPGQGQQASAPVYAAVQVVEATPVPDNKV